MRSFPALTENEGTRSWPPVLKNKSLLQINITVLSYVEFVVFVSSKYCVLRKKGLFFEVHFMAQTLLIHEKACGMV